MLSTEMYGRKIERQYWKALRGYKYLVIIEVHSEFLYDLVRNVEILRRTRTDVAKEFSSLKWQMGRSYSAENKQMVDGAEKFSIGHQQDR